MVGEDENHVNKRESTNYTQYDSSGTGQVGRYQNFEESNGMGHLISNFWNVWDSKPWTIIFVVKTYQAITYHSMNKYIYNTDLNCTSLKPTQVHLLYLYSILAGKIFGTVNGTLISKYEDYFWDIDIKNMTVSHLGHIGCITGLLMYLARKWPQNTCFRSKT